MNASEKFFHKGNLYYLCQDHDKAIQWWEKAAALGNADAQYSLGCMHYVIEEDEEAKGVETDADIEEDYEEARLWFEKAAAQGHAKAQRALGLMYEYGQTGIEDEDEDEEKAGAQATMWFEKAAEQGQAYAQFEMGQRSQDYEQARLWYEKAAAQGQAWAQYFLGDMYYEGKGVDKDYAQAWLWFEKAAAHGVGYNKFDESKRLCIEKDAAQGDASAQFCLGKMYYNGRGVDRDYAQASV